MRFFKTLARTLKHNLKVSTYNILQCEISVNAEGIKITAVYHCIRQSLPDSQVGKNYGRLSTD